MCPILELIQTLKKMFFFVTLVALICARVCTQFLQPLAQSLIGSHGTLVQPVLWKMRLGMLNGNRNPECWGDFSQLQVQIQPKSHSEFVPRDTLEFKSIKISIRLCTVRYRDI